MRSQLHRGAPYTNFLAFAEQTFFDELSEELGVDRIKFHLDLLENVKGTTDKRIKYSPERFQNVIKTVIEKSNWGENKKDFTKVSQLITVIILT